MPAAPPPTTPLTTRPPTTTASPVDETGPIPVVVSDPAALTTAIGNTLHDLGIGVFAKIPGPDDTTVTIAVDPETLGGRTLGDLHRLLREDETPSSSSRRTAPGTARS